MFESLRNGFNPRDVKVPARTTSKGKDTIINKPRGVDFNHIQNYTGNIYKIRSVPMLPDAKYISRTCPKKIVTDKERLYEENLNLKQMYNYVNEENLKMRTKILQLEKSAEQSRSQELSTQSQKNFHLIDSLKTSIKDLRTEIKAKDKEIEDMKRYIRYTKMQELEADLMQYTNECTRLKGIIDELLEDKGIVPEGFEAYENLKNDVVHLKSEQGKKEEQLKELNTRIEELTKSQEGTKENLEDKKKLARLEKELSDKDKEIKKLREEVDKARNQVASAKGEKLSEKIKEFLSAHQISVVSWVKSMTSEESLTKDAFFSALQQDAIIETGEELEEFWALYAKNGEIQGRVLVSLFEGEEVERLSVSDLLQIVKAKATYEGVQDIRTYVYEKLPNTDPVTVKDFKEFFGSGLFCFDLQAYSDALASFYLPKPEKRLNLAEKIIESFSNWIPLKKVEIEGMLKRFQSLLFDCYEDIIARLQEKTQFQSVITMDKFIEELRVYDIFEQDKEETCLRSLIYMFARSVKKVPYLKVINLMYECNMQSEFLNYFGGVEGDEVLRRSVHSFWVEINEAEESHDEENEGN